MEAVYVDADILIKNGHIIDPASNINTVGNITVSDGKIISLNDTSEPHARRVINARNMLVVPGLVDFHAHIFPPGTDYGVVPNLLLATGVTTVFDAGSSGTANFYAFKSYAEQQPINIKAFLNVSPTGIATLQHSENVNPSCWDVEQILQTCRVERCMIRGIKIRQSKEIVKSLGLEPLRCAVSIASKIGIPVIVHTTDPPCSTEEIASILRKGDVYCHVFQGKGKTIISGGRIHDGILEARERGVIFDAANGMSHFDFSVAEKAIAFGFYPDIISSDVTKYTFLQTNAYALPYIMSKYLCLGMDLYDIVRSVSINPAKAAGLSEEVGTLKVGARADIAIFCVKNSKIRFIDAEGSYRDADQVLVPQMTIKSGRIVFRQMDFNAGFDS
jgi:dihydroorotase